MEILYYISTNHFILKNIMSTILYSDDEHQYIQLKNQVIDGAIQASQFLIKHNSRGMLIGCGGQRIYKNVLAALSAHLPSGSLEYIFLPHQDPDIGSGLNLWLPICKAQVMISSLWTRFLPAFCVQGLLESRVTAIPDQGMRVDLAGCSLVAVPAHFLYSPGNFHLYDPVSKILFTANLGASMMSQAENIATEEAFKRHVPQMDLFHNRYMSGSEASRRWVALTRQLDVEMIVPQYGARITGKALVERFYQWVEKEKAAT
jgi:flavorubredoxin